MRGNVALSLLLAGIAVAASGCGDAKDASTPVACLAGSQAYLKALEPAAGDARLDDETPLPDCLAENQSPGDLAKVGEAMVAVATQLNAEARAEPGGSANLHLGYLLGAAQRGAERTEGIHADLIRRLTVAARYTPGNRPLPPTFLRTYRVGFGAGLVGP